MKNVEKVLPTLQVLREANCKFQKSIIKNCDDKVIQSLAAILHNVLIGNVELNSTIFNKLKKYKGQLQKLHHCIKKNKSIGYRRKKFVKNQIGGFWPILINAVLSGVLGYVGQKLAEHGSEQVTNSKK